MRNRPAPGELLLALLFAAVGVLWIVAAARMPLWYGLHTAIGVHAALVTAYL